MINIDGLPIPGLYAAGEMVGGIFYFNYPGGTGLMSGAVFGRIAGSAAANFARAGTMILSGTQNALRQTRFSVPSSCPGSGQGRTVTRPDLRPLLHP